MAKLQTIFDTKHLVFNEEVRIPGLIKLEDSMVRNKVYDLMVVIYQTGEGEDDPYLLNM